MHILGIGCSFTYGSELVAPQSHWDQHVENISYREQHVWLGRLAQHYGATYDNRAQPSASNMYIWQALCEYIQQNPTPQDDLLIAIAWTSTDRMSWYHDDAQRWVHSGFVRFNDNPHPADACFRNSTVEWIKHSLGNQAQWDVSLRMSTNALLEQYGARYVQFNALPFDSKTKYPKFRNTYFGTNSMSNWLMENYGTDVFAKGQHPNEQGHQLFAKKLIPYLDAKILR
mgnify:CR=1 FL=1